MIDPIPPGPAEPSRAKRLKALTRAAHERLDTAIMGAATFDSIAAYRRFVTVQRLFHRDIDALYDDPDLRAAIPDLRNRRRLPAIEADLVDLGAADDGPPPPPIFPAGRTADLTTALGWLYVAEGSTLGAAILRRDAAALGLSDTYGARHLAPAADGPAAHWRRFTAALDRVDLTSAEEAQVVSGADAAFARMTELVADRMA